MSGILYCCELEMCCLWFMLQLDGNSVSWMNEGVAMTDKRIREARRWAVVGTMFGLLLIPSCRRPSSSEGRLTAEFQRAVLYDARDGHVLYDINDPSIASRIGTIIVEAPLSRERFEWEPSEERGKLSLFTNGDDETRVVLFTGDRAIVIAQDIKHCRKVSLEDVLALFCSGSP